MGGWDGTLGPKHRILVLAREAQPCIMYHFFQLCAGGKWKNPIEIIQK
jgi:hypothetical protein